MKMYVMEICFEVPQEYEDEAKEIIVKLMEHPFGDKVELNLPFRADPGEGWTYQQAK